MATMWIQLKESSYQLTPQLHYYIYNISGFYEDHGFLQIKDALMEDEACVEICKREMKGNICQFPTHGS